MLWNTKYEVVEFVSIRPTSLRITPPFRVYSLSDSCHIAFIRIPWLTPTPHHQDSLIRLWFDFELSPICKLTRGSSSPAISYLPISTHHLFHMLVASWFRWISVTSSLMSMSINNILDWVRLCVCYLYTAICSTMGYTFLVILISPTRSSYCIGRNHVSSSS